MIIPNIVSAVPSPYFDGDLAIEPIGDFGNLGIIREKINFDFRSLKDSGKGTITAIYQIKNDGEKLPIELLFMSRGIKYAGGIKDDSVTIDGKKVAS
ncbi:MAG: hypothetical protein MJK14_17630 [Rivularia sp. ALOHA_DT_140]|nr:hypothetical protein [Rivularia sp. ALOHA_DT_140]